MGTRAKITGLASLILAISCGSQIPGRHATKDTGKAGATDDASGPIGRVLLRGARADFGLLTETPPGPAPSQTPETSAPPAPLSPAPLPTEIVVSDSITVTSARLSVALIKLKENLEPTPDEAQAEKTSDKEESRAEGGSTGTPPSLTLQTLEEAKEEPKLSREDRDSLRKSITDFIAQIVKMDDSIRFKGPFVFNAVTGKLEGGSAEATLQEGSYRRIQFKLKRNLDVDAGDPLEGNAFLITGTFKKQDGTTVGFEVAWDRTTKICLRSNAGFHVEPGVENVLGLFFDVKKWFEGVDLNTADVDEGSGSISISRRKNRDILRQIKGNIQHSTGYFKDSGTAPKEGDTIGKGESIPDTQD